VFGDFFVEGFVLLGVCGVEFEGLYGYVVCVGGDVDVVYFDVVYYLVEVFVGFVIEDLFGCCLVVVED